MSYREERDTMGTMQVPVDALWGAQTQRSLQNFRISGERMPIALIHALALVKRAAAKVNCDLGLLDAERANAIIQAADEVISGRHDAEFPLVVWQTGSGTQTNMNMNEVLANRASELLGGGRGAECRIHPNDDVNKGQSSNDVFPSAMHVAAACSIQQQLVPALMMLKGIPSRQGRGICPYCQNRTNSSTGCDTTDIGTGILGLRLPAGTWAGACAGDASASV